MPALELYDGPAYQSLRKLQRRGAMPNDVAVLIISAKYGVLFPTDVISTYDRRLDPERDAVLIAAAQRQLTKLASALRPLHVLSLLGRDYRLCLPSAWRIASNIAHASGPPGSRVRQMLDWLERKM